MVDSKNWFKSWFNSPYYHLLYDKRDKKEAQHFLDALTSYLNPKENTKILDLACGKGRHSIYLNKIGFDVLGVDLSLENIKHAKQYESKGLKFQQGDMRDLTMLEKFDITLNLFTSFGYFKNEIENLKVIQSLSSKLKNNGRVVIDYLNCENAIKKLPTKETIVKNDISFNINKKVEDGFIIKEIEFVDKGKEHFFKEYVKVINLDIFEEYFSKSGLMIKKKFGDYNLNSFDSKSSDRLIIVGEKN